MIGDRNWKLLKCWTLSLRFNSGTLYSWSTSTIGRVITNTMWWLALSAGGGGDQWESSYKFSVLLFEFDSSSVGSKSPGEGLVSTQTRSSKGIPCRNRVADLPVFCSIAVNLHGQLLTISGSASNVPSTPVYEYRPTTHSWDPGGHQSHESTLIWLLISCPPWQPTDGSGRVDQKLWFSWIWNSNLNQ